MNEFSPSPVPFVPPSPSLHVADCLARALGLPIQKKGALSDPEKCGGIQVTTQLSKVIERNC
eukprot:5999999-Pyramimonas_sp.AAC.1